MRVSTPVTDDTALFTSIEGIKSRNEMNVHFISVDLCVYGVDLICDAVTLPENIVFMRVSAYFAFCDAFCDAIAKSVTLPENIVFMRVSAYSQIL